MTVGHAGDVVTFDSTGDIVTSVDALCQHAKDVSNVIVDECHPAGNVITSIDDVVLPPQIEDRHPDSACEIVTPVDGLYQPADAPIDILPGPSVGIDACDVVTSIDNVVLPSGVLPGAQVKLLFFDIEYPLGDIKHLHVEYPPYNFKHCTRFKSRVFTSVEHPHVNYLRYNSRRRKRRKRWENHNIITVIVHGYHLVNAFRIYLSVIVTNIIAVIFHRRYP